MSQKREVYISVDVETSGPIPGVYSMLTIGACNVYDPEQVFSCELKPISDNVDPEALAVTGLSMETLALKGLNPETAMMQFQDWVESVTGTDGVPVFVGLNAPFDWSFINYYFHYFLRSNPFGFTALDIKALFMGTTGSSWAGTRSSQMATWLDSKYEGKLHEALDDAQYQAEIFRLIRAIKPFQQR
ncbi:MULTISPECIES: 3'-5' exonuclease [Enterobacteriaceae]|uniref:3'-5' exonuclease n=1 Tax=Enterobacteriaceae TaxID=543 RepID=UPI00032EACA4|nr:MULTISPECIES: 3'-5' exonuclease [Enterobacteriaceae]AID91708.1 exonuclease [Klebsiella oxytoca KONIH1]AUV90869.1 3'-5' exonuclease [Klebsiella oxytoca]EKU4735149.1 3'-5' exonuclease [Kluyvera ascorbata]ELI8048676.1 3'-5' exonuclease [Yersinia enterocolitica]HEE9982170.1 3'-5' exonuclease [Citrobacter freundii]